MELLGSAQVATIITLGDRAPFPFNFEKCTIGVLTGGRSVAFDASFAERKVERGGKVLKKPNVSSSFGNAPCVFIAFDQDLEKWEILQ